MKFKKVTIITLIFIFLAFQFSFLACCNSVNAATTSPRFATRLTTTKSSVIKGNEFTVTFKIEYLTDINQGLIALGGFLEFDKDVLEIKSKSAKGLDTWSFSETYYNLNNYKFITDSSEAVTSNSNVFQITFKVKPDAPNGTTAISLKSVLGATGEATNGIATAADKTLNIKIQDEPESLTSNVYNVGDDIITLVKPNTTIAQFKANVTTKQTMVFKDKSGNVITDETALVTTDMKLEVGTTLKYTISVTGDLDGDGLIGVADIAKMKLHYIERTLLTGIYLTSADMDNNNSIDINDIGKLKLEYIRK